MTSILKQILPNHGEVNKLHLAIENKPFLKRYLGKAEGELTLDDHYRHLRQLKCVYDAFTEILTSTEFTPKLPESLACLLTRGKRIQEDLDFLSPYVKTANKDDVLASTTEYVNYLKKLPIKKGDDINNGVLIHFLVSILGDLNGGQFLKNIVKNLYKKHGMFSAEDPDNGVRFYYFDKGVVNNLTEWLKSFIEFKDISKESDHNELQMEEIEVSDNAARLGQGAVDAFNMQSAIVDELEKTRTPNTVLKQTPVAKNNASFFSCSNVAKAAVVGTIAVGVGLFITSTITRLGS